jgi:hypothetical protein
MNHLGKGFILGVVNARRPPLQQIDERNVKGAVIETAPDFID